MKEYMEQRERDWIDCWKKNLAIYQFIMFKMYIVQDSLFSGRIVFIYKERRV